MVKNKTVLIIAHRMRTVGRRRLDCGAKGWLCGGEGTPEELLEKKGIYHHMETSG